MRDWLTTTFSEPLLNAEHITDFLIGSSQEGYAISPDCYACLRPYVLVRVVQKTANPVLEQLD